MGQNVQQPQQPGTDRMGQQQAYAAPVQAQPAIGVQPLIGSDRTRPDVMGAPFSPPATAQVPPGAMSVDTYTLPRPDSVNTSVPATAPPDTEQPPVSQQSALANGLRLRGAPDPNRPAATPYQAPAQRSDRAEGQQARSTQSQGMNGKQTAVQNLPPQFRQYQPVLQQLLGMNASPMTRPMNRPGFSMSRPQVNMGGSSGPVQAPMNTPAPPAPKGEWTKPQRQSETLRDYLNRTQGPAQAQQPTAAQPDYTGWKTVKTPTGTHKQNPETGEWVRTGR